MKKTSSCLSILALGALTTHAELIVNGGFEDDPVDTTPWSVENGAAVSISTASANSGTQSGQVDFPTTDLANLSQGFFFAEEDRLKTFTFSFSVNVEATGFSGDLGIRLSLGEWNQSSPITAQHGDIEWVAPGATGWITFSQDFTLSQTDGTYLKPMLHFYPNGTAGSVLVDDVSYVDIPEPGAYALLGGLLALGFVMIRRRR